MLHISGVDADKSAADGNTPVTSPDGKVEAVDGEVATENGNNNVTDNDKVSSHLESVLFSFSQKTFLSV